jgi:CRP-like cAMP-binding protein
MDEADFLATVPIFFLMKKRDLRRIAKRTESHLYREGDVIIREGERDGRLFIIVTGEVEVIKSLGEKNQRHLRILGPQSYFGEMALIDDLVRTASVIAKTETQVLSLDHWNLRQEIERYPAVAIELLQMLCRRIRAIEKNLMSTLGGLLPICSNCKKIREEGGLWTPIEEYVTDHSEAEFSHGLCQECARKLYPEYYTGN